MNDLLFNISKKLGDDRHAVLVWDGAGFHAGKTLEIPENITLSAPPQRANVQSGVNRVDRS